MKNIPTFDNYKNVNESISDTLLDKIYKLIAEKNDDSLSKINGQHVHKIWQDGEITMEKGGDLLGQRNLHSMDPGFALEKTSIYNYVNLNAKKMPHQDGDNGYAFVTREDANEIRNLMIDYYIESFKEFKR